jgi:A/G-specific adenine glycosylase
LVANGRVNHRYPECPSAAFASCCQRRLLSWFRCARRDLPWRRDRDPYRIWVSEVMLQQTQAATAAAYFERFIQRFPDWRSLAAAAEHEVLRQWEGLGYYQRARNLHRSARMLMTQHGGEVPRDAGLLRQLPGIGRYLAGAILSQAFDQRLPILEANSRRVLCRLFGCTADPRRSEAENWLWNAATRLLPARQVGEFNQALMELGALVCTARRPDCRRCPLADRCIARAEGRQDRLPARSRRPPSQRVDDAALVLRRRQRVLLVQRPENGRWAGMWEFPHGECAAGEEPAQAAMRHLQQLTEYRANKVTYWCRLTHGVTRFRITMHCFTGEYFGGRFCSKYYQAATWVLPQQLADYPLSSPQRRLAELLVNDKQAATRTGDKPFGCLSIIGSTRSGIPPL